MWERRNHDQQCRSLHEEEAERAGIASSTVVGPDKLNISPGIASLLQGDTRATVVSRSKIDALTWRMGAESPSRLLRLRNKVIALLEWGEESFFAQSNLLLRKLGGAAHGGPTKIVSLDAIRLGSERGNVANYYHCLRASESLETIIYEDRGENLSYLRAKAHPSPPVSMSTPIESRPSSSERLQKKEEDRSKNSITTTSARSVALARCVINKIAHRITPHSGDLSPPLAGQLEQEKAIKAFFESPRQREQVTRHRSLLSPSRGKIEPPVLRPAATPRGHSINAFIEFQAITRATLEVNQTTYEKIMQTYRRGNIKLLEVELAEAEAAIYDNARQQVITGHMTGKYMAAYKLYKWLCGVGRGK